MVNNQEELKKALIDIFQDSSVNIKKNKTKKLLVDSETTDKEKLQNMLLNILQNNTM